MSPPSPYPHLTQKLLTDSEKAIKRLKVMVEKKGARKHLLKMDLNQSVEDHKGTLRRILAGEYPSQGSLPKKIQFFSTNYLILVLSLCRPSWLWDFEYLNVFFGKLKFKKMPKF